jgi:hypothetical protein
MKAALKLSLLLLFSTLTLCQHYQFDHLHFREFTDADELPRFVYSGTTAGTDDENQMGGQTQKVIKLQ